ncbi:Predicted permease [Desulforhopalus singaporensis]|uniref:Predicted permease n=2 Tax=Desulforhopalus singaporensis TaxID=91360 RepID=A0A1H0NW97_9BACT|nr:hypothetical protein [Desulforhopalus singaporensis]SDO96944.1 Predicted permease [Desulforhopalus singaporensis]
MDIVLRLISEIWEILLDSSLFMLGGIGVAGMLKIMLDPDTILNHLGKGRYMSVVKAAFFGVPLPL